MKNILNYKFGFYLLIVVLIGIFVIDSIEGAVGTSKTFTTNSGIVKNLPHAYRGAFHRFVGLATENATPLGISTGTTGGPYSITAADYDPTDGDVELKIGSHALLGATIHTPTIIGGANGVYNRATGVLRLRIPSHNFNDTQKIKLKEESFTLSGYTQSIVTCFDLSGCLNVSACLLYTSPSPRDGLLSRMP